MAEDEVIPLSRWRAALARARRGRRADALISEPDAAQLVPQVPVQDLYYAIKEVGIADAYEVVALATPEQVRGFLDLDVWERDTIDEKRIGIRIVTDQRIESRPRLGSKDRRNRGIVARIAAEPVHRLGTERHQLTRAQQRRGARDPGRVG